MADLYNLNNGLLTGLAQGVKGGLEAFRSERDRADKLRQQEIENEFKRGLLQLKNDRAESSGEATEKIINTLYPGQFSEGIVKDLPQSTTSNLFKVMRLREGAKNREDLEVLKNKTKPPRIGKSGLLGRGPQEEGVGEWDLKAVERYQNHLIKLKKDLTPIIRGTETIDKFTNMAKTNPATAAALPIMLARAVGEKGPLSNFDVQLWGGSKAVIDRLTRSAQMMSMGTLPEKDLRFIKEIAVELGKAAKQRLKSDEQDIVDMYSSNYGGSPEQNYRLITGHRPFSEVDSVQVKKFYSPSRNKTKIVYPYGREEILDGRQ